MTSAKIGDIVFAPTARFGEKCLAVIVNTFDVGTAEGFVAQVTFLDERKKFPKRWLFAHSCELVAHPE